MNIEEVHISVTFTWDLEKADDLYEAWQLLGVPVDVGGPAFDDRMGDFTPGMYLKPGMTITSRGCNKECWFCSVPKCAKGVIRELPIQAGWNILDDNILGTSEKHFRAVIEMLKCQPERAIFSGGLDTPFMCSACGKTSSWYHAQTAKYCPNCGAKMDKEVNSDA